jgi:hypothetical protein
MANTPLEQAEELIAKSRYTIEITPEYGGKYAVDIAEVPALSQWFIPVAHLPFVASSTNSSHLALPIPKDIKSA